MPSLEWDDLDRSVLRALSSIQSQTERALLLAYTEALKEIREELSRLYEKLKDPDGKLTFAEMTKYNRLTGLDEQISGIMGRAYDVAVGELDRLPAEMYDASFFRYAWAFDQNARVSLRWGVLDPGAVGDIIRNPLDLIAKDSLSVDTRNRIRRAISQGLLQGKSFPQMARGVREAMANNAYQAIRIARTEGQRAQSAGTYAAYEKARANGIQGGDKWDATLDGRTREDHRKMDGKSRRDDGLFHLPNGETARYPVDPGLSAGQAINCRCRLRFEIEGYAPQLRRSRESGVIPYTTYDEWERGLDSRGKYNPDAA